MSETVDEVPADDTFVEPTPEEAVVEEPTPAPVEEPRVVAPVDTEDEFEYYRELFAEGTREVTGDGVPTPELRLIAWRAGYSVLRSTPDGGWKTVKRN